jgi:uncharacterized protein (TIGR00251 family)
MFWRALDHGVSVSVKVQPRSRRPGLQCADDARLCIGVAEPPEDGRANRAVCTTLAELLKVAPSTVSVTKGARSRDKTLCVMGDPAVIIARLTAL